MPRMSLTIIFAWFIMLATSTASFGVIGETVEEVATRYSDFKKMAAPPSELSQRLGDHTQCFSSPDLWVFVTFKNGRSVLEEYEFVSGNETLLIGPRTMDTVHEILFANAPKDSWVQVIGPEGGMESDKFAYAWQSKKGPSAMVGKELNALVLMAEIDQE